MSDQHHICPRDTDGDGNCGRHWCPVCGEHRIVSKPPLGLMPRYLWDESHPNPSPEDVQTRLTQIEEAIERYTDAEIDAPDAWMIERKVLTNVKAQPQSKTPSKMV